jgi:hypothetical protein
MQDEEPSAHGQSDFEKLEGLINQISDIAGSQRLAEVEALTESALGILERLKLATLQSTLRSKKNFSRDQDCFGRDSDALRGGD